MSGCTPGSVRERRPGAALTDRVTRRIQEESREPSAVPRLPRRLRSGRDRGDPACSGRRCAHAEEGDDQEQRLRRSGAESSLYPGGHPRCGELREAHAHPVARYGVTLISWPREVASTRLSELPGLRDGDCSPRHLPSVSNCARIAIIDGSKSTSAVMATVHHNARVRLSAGLRVMKDAARSSGAAGSSAVSGVGAICGPLIERHKKTPRKPRGLRGVRVSQKSAD